MHPDVRRMLLEVKCTNEGMRGLVAWVGICYDLSNHHTDDAVPAVEHNQICELLRRTVAGRTACSTRASNDQASSTTTRSAVSP